MNKNAKTALIIGGVIVAILIIVPLVFGLISGWQDGGWGMMGPGMMGGFGWMWFMPIFFILFWGLVIWGIVALVRGLSGSRGADSVPPTADSALEILKRRYARGEINKEEYEEKKKDLL
jgi:putative membrane protein